MDLTSRSLADPPAGEPLGRCPPFDVGGPGSVVSARPPGARSVCPESLPGEGTAGLTTGPSTTGPSTTRTWRRMWVVSRVWFAARAAVSVSLGRRAVRLRRRRIARLGCRFVGFRRRLVRSRFRGGLCRFRRPGGASSSAGEGWSVESVAVSSAGSSGSASVIGSVDSAGAVLRSTDSSSMTVVSLLSSTSRDAVSVSVPVTAEASSSSVEGTAAGSGSISPGSSPVGSCPDSSMPASSDAFGPGAGSTDDASSASVAGSGISMGSISTGRTS